MAINEKMKKFAHAIVDGASNKDAAISAGYPEKTAAQQGSKLKKHHEIIVLIEKLKADKEGRSLTKTEVKKVKEVNSSNTEQDLDAPPDDPYSQDDPLEFLIDVMNNAGNDMFLRFNAAKAALPYIHGKVAEKGKKQTKEEEAKKASNSGKFGTLNSQLPS
ncbi:terminase small subunit [Acinetobacter sp. ANC 4633]|uniref:terminase small subunit n=1 Tax=Acinetobacter sp. ANC 4633 TaxID=2529845 RepID=UPI00103EBF5B|nr:terminase small subunit [Acinetobacter sp. ANC 4633]TCB28675.1 terminase small subunit [Acinetobacter sp. ANC 4633]